MRKSASSSRWIRAGVLVVIGLFLLTAGYAQHADVPQVGKTSYAPVAIEKDFADTMKEMSAANRTSRSPPPGLRPAGGCAIPG